MSEPQITDAQVHFLLDLAWKCCDATEAELQDYAVRFRQMTNLQAGDLIQTWNKLPVLRTEPRPVLGPVPSGTPVPVLPVPTTPPAQPAPNPARLMPAKFNSTCGKCRQNIGIGQQIYYIKGYYANHQACGIPTVKTGMSIPAPAPVPASSPPDPQIRCDECSASFYTSGQLAVHKDTIHPMRRYRCNECFSYFSTQVILDNHTRIAHTPYPIPDVGYYAVSVPVNGVMTMRFYRVTKRRNSTTRTFLRKSSDRLVTIDPVERQMAAAIILAAPKLAMEAYGKLIGRCGCCGRQLTDPDSIALGIGPECIKRYQGVY